jgi:hypothetical protein
VILGGLTSGNFGNGAVDVRAYGIGRYGNLVLVLGISLLVSSVGGVGWFVRGDVLGCRRCLGRK